MGKALVLAFYLMIGCLNGLAQSIKNSGFDTGDLSGWRFETPATYGPQEAGYTCGVIKDSLDQNNFILQLASTQNSQWCQVKQGISYKPTDSTERLQLSARVKLEHAGSGSAGLMIRAYGNGKDYGLKTANLDQDMGWTNLSVDMVIRQPIDSLLIFCSTNAKGKAFFDQVRIKKITLEPPRQTRAAQIYLDTALAIITRYALYKDSVDFKALLQQARVLAADAQQPADCYDAIRYVLTGLHDRHSFLQTPLQARAFRVGKQAINYPSGKVVNNTIGYVRVPGLPSWNKDLMQAYADSLQQIIKSLDTHRIEGWIIDNRDNTGGNPFPMFLGLGPLLGEGVLYKRSVADKRSEMNDSTVYREGKVIVYEHHSDTALVAIATPYYLRQSKPKIAVLMNGRTASAGEMVLLSLKNKPRVKLFGEPSYGITTMPHVATLSDGAVINVYTVQQTDWQGQAYGGKIFPDETVIDNAATKVDEVVEAAIGWLTNPH